MDERADREMGNRLHLKSSTTSSSDQEQKPGFDFFEVIRLFFSHRRFIVVTTLTAAILTAGIMLLIPNKYTATARLLPSGGDDKLSALKGITGLSILDVARGSIGDPASSELFPTILNSDRVRDAALNERYTFTHDGDECSMTLMEYLNEDIPDKARAALAKIVSVSSEFKTGVITLSVTTKYPELSALVAQEFISQLDHFNRTQRRTRATEYARFVGDQLQQAEVELAQAENALAEFQSNNRDWMASSDPELQKQLIGLKRDVEVKSKTYALLIQQHEVARGEAQKDLPIVQALDEPAIPLVKSAPKRSVTVLLAMVAAFIAALISVYLRETLRDRFSGENSESIQTLKKDMESAYPRVAERISAIRSRSHTEQAEETVTHSGEPS